MTQPYGPKEEEHRLIHIPVLLQEALQGLKVGPGGRYIDCTVGQGGHAEAILASSSPDGRLLGFDLDRVALAAAERRLQPYSGRYILIRQNFSNLKSVAEGYRFTPVRGILLDLGISSRQLSDTEAGFSFLRDAPLDMRFDATQETTAAKLLNTLPEAELARIFREFGEEPKSWQIARAVVARRPIATTGQLVALIQEVKGKRQRHVSAPTLAFQALRIATNRELDNLRSVLPQALELLEKGGRLVTTAYHSVEDKVIKEYARRESRDCLCPPEAPVCTCQHKQTLRIVEKKVIRPSSGEVRRNPRSRSARMRILERL